jgi:hypothetical protein
VSHSVSLFQRYCCERDNSDVRAFAGMYLPTTEYTSGWERTYDAQLDDGAQSQVGRTARRLTTAAAKRPRSSVEAYSIYWHRCLLLWHSTLTGIRAADIKGNATSLSD